MKLPLERARLDLSCSIKCWLSGPAAWFGLAFFVLAPLARISAGTITFNGNVEASVYPNHAYDPPVPYYDATYAANGVIFHNVTSSNDYSGGDAVPWYNYTGNQSGYSDGSMVMMAPPGESWSEVTIKLRTNYWGRRVAVEAYSSTINYPYFPYSIGGNRFLGGERFDVPRGVDEQILEIKISGVGPINFVKVGRGLWSYDIPSMTEFSFKRAEPGLSILQLGDYTDVENLFDDDFADDPDSLLIPTVVPRYLDLLPQVHTGLVADDVTPLIFRVDFSDFAESVDTDFTAEIDFAEIEGGSLRGEALKERLYSLDPVNLTWVKGSSVRITHEQSVGYLFLAPIHGEEIEFSTADEAIMAGGSGAQARCLRSAVELKSLDGSILSQKQFHIAKPPVSLVHGYNANSDSWSAEFLDVLKRDRGEDFVNPIEYGVSRGTDTFISNNGVYHTVNWVDNTENTDGDLADLAPLVDQALADSVEDRNGPIRKHWALTRHDVVGHSQGGVMLRMLCARTRRYSDSQQLFSDDRNLFRGRFRRVVTIGSPHNGSLFLAWLEARREKTRILYGLIPTSPVPFALELKKLLQPKFNPFGNQLRELNQVEIDPRADFHLIQCTTTGGDPPLEYRPEFYWATGLASGAVVGPGESPKTKGELIFPDGSDGVVGLASQGAGLGSRTTHIHGINLSHSPPEIIFDVPKGNTETNFPYVAELVSLLLDGDESAFGPFVNPATLPEAVWNYLLELAPRILLGLPTIVEEIPSASLLEKGGAVEEKIRSFSVRLSDPLVFREGDEIRWTAGVLSTNGLELEEVEVLPVPDAPTTIVVNVPEGLIGEVIVFATVVTGDGDTTVTDASLVFSSLGEVSQLEVLPDEPSLVVGDEESLVVFAKDESLASIPLLLNEGRVLFESSDESVATVTSRGLVAAVAAGTATITVTYEGFSAESIVTVANSEFSHWISTFGLEESETDPSADPNSDGLSNFQAFSLGISASEPSAGFRSPSILRLSNELGGPRLVISLPAGPRSGVSYMVEATNNLMNPGSWRPIGTHDSGSWFWDWQIPDEFTVSPVMIEGRQELWIEENTFRPAAFFRFEVRENQ